MSMSFRSTYCLFHSEIARKNGVEQCATKPRPDREVTAT